MTDEQHTMTNSEVSPTVQPESSPAQSPIVPSPPNSDASTIIQPEPSPPQVLMVPSPQNTDAQVQIVPSPPNSDASTIIQPEPSPPQVLMVPSPQNTASQVQVQAVQSHIITAPIPQASSLDPQTTFNSSFAPNPNYYPQNFPNSSFAPNSTQSFSLTDFNANPQQSLMDLMSEQTYKWPNQDEQGLGNRDLFDFSGFQKFSGMNSNASNFLLDANVRFLLQVLQHLQIINHIIHSSLLRHSWMATISTTTPLQISTRCLTSLQM
jgi:hypothetical protein